MLTIRYRSSRADVWRWYWIAWSRPLGLWRSHAGIALLAAAIDVLRQRPAAVSWSHVGGVFAITFAACVAILPLWPQLRFKSADRTLTIGPQGLETRIGSRSGKVAWKAVRSIERSGPTIVVTGTNNNAFIVPARAFASSEEFLSFYATARAYHSAGR